MIEVQRTIRAFFDWGLKSQLTHVVFVATAWGGVMAAYFSIEYYVRGSLTLLGALVIFAICWLAGALVGFAAWHTWFKRFRQ